MAGKGTISYKQGVETGKWHGPAVRAASEEKGQVQMTNRKMCMAEVCAGYMEKCGNKRKDRLRLFQWIISELILLLLLTAAGTVWFEYQIQHKENYAVPSMPATVLEQTVSASVPIPSNMCSANKNMSFIFCQNAKTEEGYYAGPVGGIVKKPEEITVVLDPGHGGLDNGCARGGVREKDINLSISLKVQQQLQQMGYQVVMTRNTDEALSLGERIQTAEEAKGDIYVSIHQNSSDLYRVNGLEIYYSAQNAQADSKRLAELIHKDVLLDTGVKARSIFEWENIRVIREVSMPSCLIETGFLTNGAERRKLADPSYQQSLANGIAKGIDQYFSPEVLYLTFQADVTEKNTKSMLQQLKDQNIKAVFFITGDTVTQNPEVVKQIAEAGHTFGIYENSQKYQSIYPDIDQYLTDLKNTYETTARISGTAPVLFSREPAAKTGSIPAETVQKLKESGFPVYQWTPGF